MWHPVCLALLLVGLATFPAHADPPPSERGLPAITVVAPAALNGPQLFAITASGPRIYVGTQSGMSVYDGAHWESVPSDRAVYALAVSPSGRVIGGGPDSLQELRVTADGRRTLASLLPADRERGRPIGDVRAVHAFGETFLIVTDRQLLELSGARLHVIADWPSDGGRRAFASRGVLYIVSQGSVEAFTRNGTRHEDAITRGAPVSGAVTVIGDGPDGTQLAAIEGHGLFAVAGGAWHAVTDAGVPVLASGLTDLALLDGGAVAVSTNDVGVVLLTPALEIDRVIGRAEGLPSPHVDALVQDVERGVWTLGPAQLARVDLGGPLSLVDARLGLEGTVNGVVRHQGRLHVLTTSGLFVMGEADGPSHRAVRIPGVPGRTWDGLDRGDHLLVAGASGVFEVRGDRAQLVPGTARLSAYVLAPRRDRPDTVLVGTRTGVSVLVRDGAGWRFDRDLPGAPRYSRSIVSRPEGVVYIGSVFDGVVRLDLDTPGARPVRVGDGEVFVVDVGGTLHALHTTPPALSVLDEGRGQLAPAPGGRTFDPGVVRFAIDGQGALWAVGRGAVRYAPGQAASRTVIDRSTSVQTVHAEADGVVWLGGPAGLWRFSGDAPARLTTRPPPTLERVLVNGRAVAITTGDGTAPALPFGIERLRLEFSPNTFAAAAQTEFKLEPLDTAWSADRRGHSVEYTSLPEGEYRLRFRSSEGGSEADHVWAFTVRPPWHRTPLVYALQGAFVVVVALLVIGWRTQRLRRRSRELELAIVDQTDALQDAHSRLAEFASRDQLTGLYNRRHFETALAHEWVRAHRLRRAIALVMVDIDHFKALNDSLGHVAGDDALRAVASVIAQCARRAGDVAARFGGEEFVVLLPGAEDAYVRALAEEIRAAVEALDLQHPAVALLRVTVSVGVATVAAPATLEPTLVAAADRALYRAKAAGRNGVAA